jgi:acid phosphatase
MLVIVTYDENGGWWDHVSPPKGDRFGPASRIPALIISPYARRGAVDHTVYDTTSILRFLTRRYGLPTLPGIATRDAAIKKQGGQPIGDLTNALIFPGT